MNPNNKLVSIITPCYNGENYISRFIECILSQTYNNIELILINDGSTDKTYDIIKNYIDKLNNKGIIFKYIYQTNQGQAAAINKGLKIFNGDFLVWQDCDDILDKDFIKDRVNFLTKNPDCGIVFGKINSVKEDNLKKVVSTYERKNTSSLFYDLLLENNVCFNGYMTRREVILDVLPKKQIYESRAGQNWQLLLPITFKYKYGYLEKCTYTYVIRKNSHSRIAVKFDDLFQKTKDHEDILLNVIKNINMSKTEKENCLNLIKIKYIRKRLILASTYSEVKLCIKQMQYLKSENALQLRDFKFLIGSNRIIRKIINLLKNLLHK